MVKKNEVVILSTLHKDDNTDREAGCVCNSSTWKGEVGRPCEFKASLDYTETLSQNKN